MADAPDDLFPEARNPHGTTVLNDRCVIRTSDGHRALIIAGIPWAHYAVTDRMSEAHAMVSLVEQGWADQQQVARAFGCSARTVRRNQRRFEDRGLAALGHGRGYPRGRFRLQGSRRRAVQQLKAQGHSQREIARRLGITEKAVRKILRRLGWKPTGPSQAELGLESESAAQLNPRDHRRHRVRRTHPVRTQNCPLFRHRVRDAPLRAASTRIQRIGVGID